MVGDCKPLSLASEAQATGSGIADDAREALSTEENAAPAVKAPLGSDRDIGSLPGEDEPSFEVADAEQHPTEVSKSYVCVYLGLLGLPCRGSTTLSSDSRGCIQMLPSQFWPPVSRKCGSENASKVNGLDFVSSRPCRRSVKRHMKMSAYQTPSFMSQSWSRRNK